MESIDDIKKYLEKQKLKDDIIDVTAQCWITGKSDKILGYKPLKYLYKYFSPEIYNLDAIANENVWMSRPSDFNDPYDSAINLDSEYIKNIMSNQNTSDYIKSNINDICGNIQFSINDFNNRVRVSCYSEIDNSILMWSHYAQNHKGFCAEYGYSDISQLEGVRNDGLMLIVPIAYKNRNLVKITDDCDIKIQMIKLVFYKSFDWIYEQEWRQTFISLKELPIDSKGLIVKSTPIKSIIMGCKIESSTENMLKFICETKGIKLDKMIMDENSFLLKRVEVLPSK